MAGPRWSRTGLRWAACALAAAGLLHGAFWLSSVHRVDALVEERAQLLRGQGWRIVLGAARPQGWPASAGLQFGPTSIETDGFAWEAGRVTIDAPLRWPGSTSGTTPSTAQVWAEGQRIRFGSGPAHAVVSRGLRVEVSGDAATLVGTGVAVAPLFEAEALQLRFAPDGLALAARRLTLSEAARMGVPVVDTLALHASATPPVRWAGRLRPTALAWRQAGGVVDMSDVALTMGRTHAVGRGKIWLDDALQPRLDGAMHVTGYEAGLDDLAAAGVLTRQGVVAAKAVLGLLAAPALDGGADVPIQVEAGTLTVARFPLLRMPVLEWPTESPGP